MRTIILFLGFLLAANIAHAELIEYGEVDNTQAAMGCVSSKDGHDASGRPAYFFSNSCPKTVIVSRTYAEEKHAFITRRLEIQFKIKAKPRPFMGYGYTEMLKPGDIRIIEDSKATQDFTNRDMNWGACFAPWRPFNISTKKSTVEAGKFICAKLSPASKKKLKLFYESDLGSALDAHLDHLNFASPSKLGLGDLTDENWWRYYVFLSEELLEHKKEKGLYWMDGKECRANNLGCYYKASIGGVYYDEEWFSDRDIYR